MKKFFLFALTFVLSATMHAQWEKLPLYGGHAEKLVQSKFNSNDIFAITAKSGVWYSSDGGDNWRAINGENNLLVGMEVRDLEVTSDGVFWIIAYWESIWRLYKSTDRGKNWTQIPTIGGTGLNVDSRIECAKDGSLFLQVVDYTIGGNYSLLNSTDNGNIWRKIPLPREAEYRYTAFSIDKNNASNICIYGSRGFIATTTDIGSTWDISTDFYSYISVESVTFFERSGSNVINAFTFAYNDVEGPAWYDYYESLDTGKTWIKKSASSIMSNPGWSNRPPTLINTRTNTLFTIAWNALYRSSDEGMNWSKLSDDNIWDIALIDSKLICSFTLIGIQSSTDDGATWFGSQSIDGFSAFDTIEFSSTNENTFFVIVRDKTNLNARYELRQSTNRGQTWKTLFGSPSLKNLRVTDFPEPRYYAVSTSTAIISGTLDQTQPDTILTWIPVKEKFLLYSQYYQLELSDAQPGLIYVMAFTSAGRKLFSSSDVGNNWTSHLLPSVSYRYFEIFPSRLHPGWVVAKGSPSYSIDLFGMGVLLSTNNGSTWDVRENKDPVNSNYSLTKNDLIFDNGLNLFSTDYAKTWYRNEMGIPDSMKGRIFTQYPSGNRLIIAQGTDWYQLVNDAWKPVTDRNGNKPDKGLPAYVQVVGNDLYGSFSNEGLYRLENSNVTAIQQNDNTETDFSIQQNYPNPFVHNTTISFNPGNDENATLRISDALGRVLKVFRAAGEAGKVITLTWDAKDDNGNDVPAGVYFYSLLSNGQALTRQLTLVR